MDNIRVKSGSQALKQDWAWLVSFAIAPSRSQVPGMPSILSFSPVPRTSLLRFARTGFFCFLALCLWAPSQSRAQTVFQFKSATDKLAYSLQNPWVAPSHASRTGLQFSPLQLQRRDEGPYSQTRWANSASMGLSADPNSQIWMDDQSYPNKLSMERIIFEFETPEDPLSYGKMFKKGAILIGGFEFAVMATMMVLPKSFTGWHEDFLKVGADNFVDAYGSAPTWDEDHWYHNYLGHPYVGSIYYNTVRCQGATPVESFFFSTAMSVWWEYAVESIAEHPSTQDLLVTPIAGSLMGEAVHQLTLAWMEDDDASIIQKVIVFVLNPTHVVLVGF